MKRFEVFGLHFGLKSLLATIMFLQFTLVFSIYCHISILRQVLGFIYLTLAPGIVITKLLKLEKFNIAEVFSLCIGLSQTFLMFTGLLLNELLPLIRFTNPLSTDVLITTFSLIITLLCALLYFKSNDVKSTSAHLVLLDKLVLIVLICLPILSVFGTLLMNANTDNSLLLLFFMLVPLVISTVLILCKKFTFDIFPLALLIIYAAILFVTWLTTNYIYGYDSHSEFYSFRITEKASLWNPTESSLEIEKGNAMLSVTILPAIYAKVMGIDAAWVFKVVYPLLAAFVPFILYQFFLLHTKREAAFLGVFLFITHSLEGLGSIKEWIATIFYVLLLFIIFSDKIPSSKRKMLFILFAGGLVVSHYSKSYIFMFILIFIWVISFAMKKNLRVTLDMVLLFLSMAFVWYIFMIHGATFEALLSTANNIYKSLTTEFFNPESRGPTIMTAIGLISPPTYLHIISRVFFYLTVLLILTGFISITIKFWKERSNLEYFILACVNMGLLAMTIILPNLAESYRMVRFYRTALIVLAPLCFLGSEEIVANLHKLRFTPFQRKFSALFLTLVVLVPFFLFQTGFVYEVAKVECWFIPLSRYRMSSADVSWAILYGTETYGAKWLSEYTNMGSAIYSDQVARDHVLTSYGLIDYGRFHMLANTTSNLETGSFIYLRRLNTHYRIMIGGNIPQWNLTDLQPLLDIQNVVYSNEDCSIYANHN